MGEEFPGMTASQFERMQADGNQGRADDDDLFDDDQNQDVNPGSSTDDDQANNQDDDYDFGDDMGQGDGDDAGDDDGDVDSKGVSWKNRFKESERKRKALEAKLKQGQDQPSDQQIAPEQQSPPPQVPPQGYQQYPSQYQQQYAQQYQPVQPQPPQPTLEQQAMEIEQRMAQTKDQAELARLSRQLGRIEASITYQSQVQEQQRERLRMESVTRIQQEFPDAFNPQSLLAQWANYHLTNAYGGNTDYAELAVRMAADQLKIQPKSVQMQQQERKAVNPSKLPRSRPTAPVTEKGTPANSSKEPKIPEETLRAAKRMGVSVKDVQKMIKRQGYTYASGESVFGG